MCIHLGFMRMRFQVAICIRVSKRYWWRLICFTHVGFGERVNPNYVTLSFSYDSTNACDDYSCSGAMHVCAVVFVVCKCFVHVLG